MHTKTYIVLICIIALNGCALVGVVAIGDKSSRINNPNISSNDKCISAEISDDTPMPADELLRKWGKPNKVFAIGRDSIGYDNEKWRYEFGYRWNGLLFGFIIPIPILIPVGHDYIEFNIQDGEVISAFMKDDSGKFGVMVFQVLWEEESYNTYNTIGFYDDMILKKYSCEKKEEKVDQEE